MEEEWWGKGMQPRMNLYHSSSPANSLRDGNPVEEEGLAQSRQGAKEEGHELREPILCVSAPLRDIFLCLPEMMFRHAVRHSRRSYFGRSKLLVCRVVAVLAESPR
jgi:hypothetical protein